MTEDEKRASIEGFVSDLISQGYSPDEIQDVFLDELRKLNIKAVEND